MKITGILPSVMVLLMVFNTEVLFGMLDNLFSGVNFLILLVGIGTLLAAKRKSRTDFRFFSREELDQVIRHSSLERKEYGTEGELAGWQTAICIPFGLIGMDGGNLPENIRANFYKCGDKTAHPHFLSWNPVEVPHPDFHRPEFFGKLIF